MAEQSRAGQPLQRQGSLYNLLEVNKEASPEEIKASFRRLALKCHPDKCPNNPAAAEQFKKLNKAYIVLGDPKKRHLYDQYGHLGAEVAERMGDDPLSETFLSACGNHCVGALILVLCVLTGCCFGCFCCCFCCCCGCCGLCCKRKQAVENLEGDEEANEEANETDGANAVSARQYEAVPLTEQPASRTVVTETHVTETVVITQPGGGDAQLSPPAPPEQS